MSSPLQAVAFIDGQNLFHSVKAAFGYLYPNYDVKALAETLCGREGWDLKQVRFYSGLPDPILRPAQHAFWSNKLLQLSRQGVWTFTRPVKYSRSSQGEMEGREKGVDVRIAIDVIRLAFESRYDVALLFSQDQDFIEVAEAVRIISKLQQRFLKIASAFPTNPNHRHLNRGIDKTDWKSFDKACYDQCIDHRDYRGKGS